MTNEVTAFQLGTSTVITIPKIMGIKPGQKFEVKRLKNGALLKLARKRGLLEIMESATKDNFWTDEDFKDYKNRRKFGIEAIKKMKKIW